MCSWFSAWRNKTLASERKTSSGPPARRSRSWRSWYQPPSWCHRRPAGDAWKRSWDCVAVNLPGRKQLDPLGPDVVEDSPNDIHTSIFTIAAPATPSSSWSSITVMRVPLRFAPEAMSAPITSWDRTTLRRQRRHHGDQRDDGPSPGAVHHRYRPAMTDTTAITPLRVSEALIPAEEAL